MRPLDTLTRFDGFLTARGLRLDAVVVGGAALALMGVVARETRDCDVIHPELPGDIQDAARAFAQQESREGVPLPADWLNNGPASLTTLLPPGWQDRLQPIFTGKAVTLRCLGRRDLLLTKLFALCDRGSDLLDCMALRPTADEIHALMPWVQQQDANPDWPAHVEQTLKDLARRLGHGL
jgi:hypothetical protein